MLRFRQKLPALPALLAVVVALALANPFCCHFLPAFAAEAAQTETAFDARDTECAGKPEAVTEDDLSVPPPMLLALWRPAALTAQVAAALRPTESDHAPEPAARVILFGNLRL